MSSVPLSLSPAISFADLYTKEEAPCSHSVADIKKKRIRIRKKTEKRIDVVSESPTKPTTAKKRRRSNPENSASSDDLGAITWGTPKSRKVLNTQQEYDCCQSLIHRKIEIEKELRSLLTVSKNRQNESSLQQSASQYPDSNTSIAGFDSDISLTQQIHSMHDSNPFVSNDLPVPSAGDKQSSIKCMAFGDTGEKDSSGFDSMLDSSILEEVDRIEAESQIPVLNDSDLFMIAESMS